MARAAHLLVPLLLISCGSSGDGTTPDGGADEVRLDGALDAAASTGPDATTSDGQDASSGPTISCGATTCRADQVCVDARECRATSGFCCGGVDAGPCEPATVVPHCADVPPACGGTPTCGCLPNDVCDVVPGTHSPYGCAFVDSSGHVACLAA